MKQSSVVGFFFILIAHGILSSCKGPQEKTPEEKNLEEHDSLQTVKIHYDELVAKILEFKTNVTEQQSTIHYWVNEQSRADDQKKLGLLELENESRNLLDDLEPMMENEDYKKHFNDVSTNLIDLFFWNGEIRSLLPSFVDYEDITIRFMTSSLISQEGEYNDAFEKLMFSIEDLLDVAQHDLDDTNIKLEINEKAVKKI